jgi:hypothetical protein
MRAKAGNLHIERDNLKKHYGDKTKFVYFAEVKNPLEKY